MVQSEDRKARVFVNNIIREELDNLIPNLCPTSWVDNSGNGCIHYRCIFRVNYEGPHEFDLESRMVEHQKQIKSSIGIDYFPVHRFEDVFVDVLEETKDDKVKETDAPGGGWNYRVVRKINSPDPDEPFIYQIHEIHYNKSGDVVLYSGPMEPLGETLDELKADLLMMRAAFCEPVLNEWELPGYVEEETYESTYGPSLDAEILLVVDDFIGNHTSFTAEDVVAEVELRTSQNVQVAEYIASFLDDMFKNGEMAGYTREVRGADILYFHKSDYMAQQYTEHMKSRPYVCNAHGKFYVDNEQLVGYVPTIISSSPRTTPIVKNRRPAESTKIDNVWNDRYVDIDEPG